MDSSPSLSDLELSKKLIQLVKDQPFLYDKDLEDYKDEAKKNAAWKIIGDSLDLGVDETQVRWARLRVDFGRHRRKRQAAEACGAQIRDWSLYSSLTWLAPHVKMRAKREKSSRKMKNSYDFKPILPHPEWHNDDDGVKVEVDPSIVVQNGHEGMTESFIVSPDAADYDDEASFENSHNPFKRKDFGSGKDHSYSSSSHAAESHSSQMANLEEENEDSLFCRSICASLNRFSHHQRALAKIRIQQLNEGDIKDFIKKHSLELPLFLEDMKTALCGSMKSDHIHYSIEGDDFVWKQSHSRGFAIKKGQIKIAKVPFTEKNDLIIQKLFDKIHMLEESQSSLQTKLDNTSKGRDMALEKVKEIAAFKTEWESKLYGRFVAVLNAKKERIQSLEEELGLRDAQVDEHQPPQRTEGGGDDPYADDTDVDSDAADPASPPRSPRDRSPSPPAPVSSAQRRPRNIFSSFESEDGESPIRVLPKRAKLPAEPAESAEPAPTSRTTLAATSMDCSAARRETEVAETEDLPPLPDSPPGESTQDLLDEF